MTRRPTHGVVSLAALDLRRVPDHRGALESQLLMGEVVRVRGASRDGAWLKIENLTDGDRGWARSWGIVPADAARAARWRSRARARVMVAYAEVRAIGSPGAGALVSPLVWGGRVIAGPVRAGHRAVVLPDGRRGRVAASAFASPRRRAGPAARANGHASAPSIVDRVRSLLGVPYLWGGRTPVGMDCSAFTQLVLAEQGLALPRDASEQFRACTPIGRNDGGRLGDLVFFAQPGRAVGHVGLALGGGYYAHCRGRVRINSLDPDNPLYDGALGRQLRGVRRPRRRPRPAA